MPSISEAIDVAIGHQEAGRLREAEQIYRQILAINPEHADANHLLGVLAHTVGKFEIAERLIGKAIAANGNAALFHGSLGNALYAQGKYELAIASYRRAVALNPMYAEALNNLGNALGDLGQHSEAIACYQRALKLAPDYVEVYNNLGGSFNEQGKFDEAIACYHSAIQLKPDYADAFTNLGNVLKDQGKLEEAITHHRRALEIEPNNSMAYNNLGVVWKEMLNLQESAACFDRALALNPNYASARHNRATLNLFTGNFDQGWQEYESRWQDGNSMGPLQHFPKPLWEGQSLADKTILLFPEQGIGDEIMFASCIPDIAPLAKKCLLACEARLIPLFKRSFPQVEAISFKSLGSGSVLETLIAQVDYKLPIGSLPRFFRKNVASFPKRPTYLIAAPELVDKWRKALKRLGDGLRVGISWKGGAKREVIIKRSTTLAQWKDVLQTKRVQFINVQYGNCGPELKEAQKALGVEIHSFAEVDPLQNMDEFAALLASLDLVISIDNSTVHLAGALGVPTWVALPFVPDWRWLLNRADSPWYSSLRLFRQSQRGEWSDLLERIKIALQHEINQRK